MFTPFLNLLAGYLERTHLSTVQSQHHCATNHLLESDSVQTPKSEEQEEGPFVTAQEIIWKEQQLLPKALAEARHLWHFATCRDP